MTIYILLILIFVFALLNIIATFVIVRRSEIPKKRKVAQIIFVWLIPIVAAVFVILFYKNEDDDGPKNGKGAIGGGSGQTFFWGG